MYIVHVHMSHVVRKPAFCICENNGADQLRGNCEADQCLCFPYTDSSIPLLPKSGIFKPLAIFCGCTARFECDLVGNPEDRFSHNEAHIRFSLCLNSITCMFEYYYMNIEAFLN